MYTVYCDGYKIYDYRIDKYNIFDAKLELELNKTGSFTFMVYPDNPNFAKLQKMKSIITVYQKDYLIFRGRILNDEEGFVNEKQVVCEGELAFLLDSVQRPYDYTAEGGGISPANLFTQFINNHNAQVEEAKRFEIGTVNVTDPDGNDYISRADSTYLTTWESIQQKLIDGLGGYLWVDYADNGKRRINYVSDFDTLGNQSIIFGKNLLDVNKSTRGEDLATAIIPLGGSGEDRITIGDSSDTTETVVDGTEEDVWKKGDYVYSKSGVEKHGWIFKKVEWSDVESDVDYLIKAAAKYLTDSAGFTTSIELTAADLAGIENVNPFRLGVKINVKDDHHGLNDSSKPFLVSKLSLDLLRPTNNKLTVGTTVKTLTDSTSGSAAAQTQIAEKVDKINSNISGFVTANQLDAEIAEVTEQNSSTINQLSTEIMTQVSQDYYLKRDADALVQSVNTQFTQTNEEFELRFNEFTQSADDVQAGNDAQFREISKYIKFVDGNILLGEDGNELTLKIQNDRISFLQNNAEVAYFSNRKLYVLDGEYVNQLTIGKFAFIPRANGNLSFKKVK